MITEGTEEEAVLEEADLALNVIRSTLVAQPVLWPLATAISAYLRTVELASDLLTASLT